ncbi:hypothetical protein KY313_03405 [Candidatus Woesearchaeota archaeon]|nr:hypothetical protein [Candidatus Woesearchaeota archaeon]
MFKELSRWYNLFLSKRALPKRLRKRADKYYRITLRDFIKKSGRKPNKNELFEIVVKTSHRAYGARRTWNGPGHDVRQLIRKYLLLKNRIRLKYELQPLKRKRRNKKGRNRKGRISKRRNSKRSNKKKPWWIEDREIARRGEEVW